MPTLFLLDPRSFGGTADPRALNEAFRALGVPCHLIPRGLLDTPGARPGHEGEWEWRVSATGRAVAIRAAQGDWRGLG